MKFNEQTSTIGRPARVDDVIFNGRVTRANIKKLLRFVCGECHKEFTPDKVGLIYSYNMDATINLHCPRCIEKYKKYWTISNVLEITSTSTIGIGKAKCKFADGSIREYTYGSTSTTGIPEYFYEQLAPYRQAYRDELEKKKCTNVEITDTYEEQYITCTFGDGKSYRLEYKTSVEQGIRYNPKSLEVLEDEQISKINILLQDRGLQNFYIK